MNSNITTGVEMEVWVVDERGRLVDGQAIVDAHERIEPEFVDPLLEVKTEPHDSVADLRRDLANVLSAAIEAAADADQRLVSLGTPLTATDAPANCERGRLFERIYGDGVVSAKNCAGTHVHFGQTDVTRQLNLLTALDPALALVSSSPYYLGERRRDSSRAAAYRTECGAAFRQYCDLWSYADGVDEWESRVDRAYEDFLRLAGECGVVRERVEASFEPEDTVLNPVRLRRNQATVEWRAPDSTLPSQTIRLVDDIRKLVDRVESTPVEVGRPGVRADHLGVPRFAELWELRRLAIDRGLDSGRVREYLRSFGLNPAVYRPVSGRLYGPEELTEATAREIRLEYARRLEADVESLTDEPTAAAVRRLPKLG
jgi:hypothetical protein